MRTLAAVLLITACGSRAQPRPAAPLSNAPPPPPLVVVPPAPPPAEDDDFGGMIGNTADPDNDTLVLAGRHNVGASGAYGRIGHGAYPPPPANGPKVTIGQPQAQGQLDKVIIRRFVRRDIADLRACYEHVLATHPGLAGTVVAAFTIDPTGAVLTASARGLHADVETCVARVIRAIHFPAPAGGGKVVVTYPLVFEPTP